MLGMSPTLELAVGALFLGVLLFSKAEISYYHLMFILCANELLNFGTTSLTMIFTALFTIKHWVMSKKHLVDIKYMLSLVCIISFCLFLFLSGSGEQLSNTIKQVFFLYFMTVVLRETEGHWDKLFGNTFKCIAVGIIYFGMLSFLTNGLPSLGTRYTFHEDVTINFFGIISALSIVNMLYYKIILRGKVNTLLIIGCLFFGILTQSRSFILATAIGIVLIILLSPKLKQKLKIIAGAIAVFCVLAFVISCIPVVSQYIEVAFLRIIDPNGDDISNGRYTLWDTTIQNMMENRRYFWFGAGDFKNVAAAFDEKVMVAHNVFLETWVVYGVLGCALMVVVFGIYINKEIFYKKRATFSFVAFTPLIVLFCALFYSHHFIGRSMSMIFVISWLPLAIGIPALQKERLK